MSKSVDWQKTLDTISAGASESGGAVWGIFGQDVITEREADLAKEQMKLDAAKAQSEAAKDAALYSALAGSGQRTSSGGMSGSIQRPRPAGMPAVRQSSGVDQTTIAIGLAVALGLFLVLKK